MKSRVSRHGISSGVRQTNLEGIAVATRKFHLTRATNRGVRRVASRQPTACLMPRCICGALLVRYQFRSRTILSLFRSTLCRRRLRSFSSHRKRSFGMRLSRFVFYTGTLIEYTSRAFSLSRSSREKSGNPRFLCVL